MIFTCVQNSRIRMGCDNNFEIMFILYKKIWCGFQLELHCLYEAVLMRDHNSRTLNKDIDVFNLE